MTDKDNTQDVQGVVERLLQLAQVAPFSMQRKLCAEAATLLLSEHEGRGAAEALIYAPDGKTFRTALFEEAAKRGQAQARVEELERALGKIAEDFGDYAENDPRAASLWHSMAIEQQDMARQALNPTGAAG